LTIKQIANYQAEARLSDHTRNQKQNKKQADPIESKPHTKYNQNSKYKMPSSYATYNTQKVRSHETKKVTGPRQSTN
jgi:hypothetical protein